MGIFLLYPILKEVKIVVSPTDHRKIGRLVIFVIPIIILLGLAIPPAVAWIYGAKVVLQATAQPQHEDKSFVLLQYTIEKVPAPLLSDTLRKTIATGAASGPVKVFGKLAKQGNYHVLTELTDRKPDGGTYLSGRLQNAELDTDYTVDFGLARFHLLDPENEHAPDPWVAQVNIKSGYGIVTKINSNRLSD
ncbi:hypothetical protein AB1K83_00625 [Sporosarcina sp. 179-K 3D1 HS]|uniref:hypothetical protein n=1 Tax=Sporosarcina sp. 179-K 3D1 HS TaxID=3232169 RepID=UPI0039A3348A